MKEQRKALALATKNSKPVAKPHPAAITQQISQTDGSRGPQSQPNTSTSPPKPTLIPPPPMRTTSTSTSGTTSTLVSSDSRTLAGAGVTDSNAHIQAKKDRPVPAACPSVPSTKPPTLPQILEKENSTSNADDHSLHKRQTNGVETTAHMINRPNKLNSELIDLRSANGLRKIQNLQVGTDSGSTRASPNSGGSTVSSTPAPTPTFSPKSIDSPSESSGQDRPTFLNIKPMYTSPSPNFTPPEPEKTKTSKKIIDHEAGFYSSVNEMIRHLSNIFLFLQPFTTNH